MNNQEKGNPEKEQSEMTILERKHLKKDNPEKTKSEKGQIWKGS